MRKSVPANSHVILNPIETGECKCKRLSYRKAIGSSLFVATILRPDITFTVSNVSKYVIEHDNNYWNNASCTIS